MTCNRRQRSTLRRQRNFNQRRKKKQKSEQGKRKQRRKNQRRQKQRRNRNCDIDLCYNIYIWSLWCLTCDQPSLSPKDYGLKSEYFLTLYCKNKGLPLG